jgi:hypothetical protein
LIHRDEGALGRYQRVLEYLNIPSVFDDMMSMQFSQGSLTGTAPKGARRVILETEHRHIESLFLQLIPTRDPLTSKILPPGLKRLVRYGERVHEQLESIRKRGPEHSIRPRRRYTSDPIFARQPV